MNITSAKITSEGLLLETAAPEAARFVYGFKPGDYEITLVKKKRSLKHQKDAELDKNLKKTGQLIAMGRYGWTTDDFIKQFGKNYL